MIGLAVALAGGVGAVLRFVVDGLVGRRRRGWFPLGTVVINVSGSFLLGVLTGLALDHVASTSLTLVLGTGLVGGYTTFSTASVEAVNLALADGSRATLLAVTHALGMLVLGLLAAGLGIWLA